MGREVIIGANSTIIAGVTIGDRVVIAAGSTVTKDVPSSKVVKGVPAKEYMDRDEYEEKKKKHYSSAHHV
ncbi:MAG: DapH/DapD/GlmU-related protein [Nitrososphaerota archaeon]